jgi:membrane-bound lytic murein transglycosylase D
MKQMERKFGNEPLQILALMGLLIAAVLLGMLDEQPLQASAADAAASLTKSLSAGTAVPVAGPQWDLANLDHPRVDFWIDYFTTEKRDDFARFLQRMGLYEPMISAKLAERGMPQDLIYLAMIESGFNARAYSRAAASGIWQFVGETGQRYGLEINRAVDERNDPVKSTDAALKYLSDMHRRFGSWYLAAAGYNTGENRIGRIMREVTGSERGSDEDYYRIWNRLPGETRDYVPMMIAAGRIAKERHKYGFDRIQSSEPLQYLEKTFAPATPLVTIARAAGTSIEEIRQLNPQLKMNRTRNDQASIIRIPERRM